MMNDGHRFFVVNSALGAALTLCVAITAMSSSREAAAQAAGPATTTQAMRRGWTYGSERNAAGLTVHTAAATSENGKAILFVRAQSTGEVTVFYKPWLAGSCPRKICKVVAILRDGTSDPTFVSAIQPAEQSPGWYIFGGKRLFARVRNAKFIAVLIAKEGESEKDAFGRLSDSFFTAEADDFQIQDPLDPRRVGLSGR